VPVTVTCRVLGFSTQGYYQWLADPVTRPTVRSSDTQGRSFMESFLSEPIQ